MQLALSGDQKLVHHPEVIIDGLYTYLSRGCSRSALEYLFSSRISVLSAQHYSSSLILSAIRNASAEIVNEGLAPNAVGIIDPSAM